MGMMTPLRVQGLRSARQVGELAKKIAFSGSRFAQRQELWHNRAYMTLWGTKVISATGSQMTQIAFPLLVLAITHSASIAGIAGALRLFPYLILSLPAGAIIDRGDRRRVMLVCET